jgi:hypothetical protein
MPRPVQRLVHLLLNVALLLAHAPRLARPATDTLATVVRVRFPWRTVIGTLLGALLATAPSFAAADSAGLADDNAGTWQTLAPVPIETGDNGAAVGSDGRIYVYGGSTCTATHDFDCAYVTTVEAYTPTTNTWATVAPLPNPRRGFVAATGADGRVYAIGGTNDQNILDTGDVYDPKTNRWSPIAPMPHPNFRSAGAAGSDGRIYIFGGTDNVSQAYDPRTNTWQILAPMPSERYALTVALGSDGRLYAIGGTGSGQGAFIPVEAYDPETNTWICSTDDKAVGCTARTIAPKPPRWYGYGATTGRDGRIYVVGNSNLTKPDNTSPELVYSAKNNTWATFPELNKVRDGLNVVTGVDGRIYAIGGSVLVVDSDTSYTVYNLNTVEAYTPLGLPAGNASIPTAPPPTARCSYALGFKALHDLIPAQVGDCLDSEGHNSANGDALQHTAKGLLVWRKVDNWTAFTDGYRTWVNGPNGLQERLNTQRFQWEANPDGLSLAN